MIRFTIKPDYSDYLAANWLVFRRGWLSRRMLILIIVLIVTFTGIDLLFGCLECGFSPDYIWPSVQSGLIFGLGIPIVIGVMCAFSIPKLSRRTFEQLGTIDQVVDYAFGEDGMTAVCETGTSNLKWRHFTDFLLGKESLIVRRTPSIIYLIPLRLLSPDVVVELVSALRNGGVRQS